MSKYSVRKNSQKIMFITIKIVLSWFEKKSCYIEKRTCKLLVSTNVLGIISISIIEAYNILC